MFAAESESIFEIQILSTTLVERFNFGAVTLKTLLRRFVNAVVAVGDSCEANPN